MHKLRYRQIHLDFHTSPDIEGIGAEFDKRQWQEALKAGHVDSITCSTPTPSAEADRWSFPAEPSRRQGEFDFGACGIRFWDPEADNTTAAVVRETGMQCFTGGTAFVPWASIL